jgi:hypothetical protein
MSSGLNPVGTLCLGAINTSIVLIGNAIKIDNTTAISEITIDGEAYVSNGSPTVFPNIISSAGLNPTGTLRIGTSNTSEVIMGLLKIDNTVVPPQIYINEIALPPRSLTNAGDKFTLQDETQFYTYDYAYPSDPLITQWNYSERTDAVQFQSYEGARIALSLVAPGIYDIRFNLNITALNWSTSPAKFFWTPTQYATSSFTDDTNDPISANDELPDSSIDFTFNGTSNETFTGYKQFLVYTTSANSAFNIVTNTLAGRTNKIGTDITIKRIGDWPPTAP